jgi:hypothetical protein
MLSSNTTTIERTVEKPIVIEKPVMIDRPVDRVVTVEKPVMIDRVVEKPVVIDRYIDNPVLMDRVIERPVLMDNTCTQYTKPVVIEKRVEIDRPSSVILKQPRHLLDVNLFLVDLRL